MKLLTDNRQTKKSDRDSWYVVGITMHNLFSGSKYFFSECQAPPPPCTTADSRNAR